MSKFDMMMTMFVPNNIQTRTILTINTISLQLSYYKDVSNLVFHTGQIY